VLIFNYDNGRYADPEDAEQKWADLIFGTGSTADGTASINDFYKDMSGGKFYFNPVLLGDNTTGVYSFRLEKNYSDAQWVHDDYPYFDFSYDAMLALKSLESMGLNVSDFTADDINPDNFQEIMENYYYESQSDRPAQRYSSSKIMFIFPPYNIEKVDITPVASTDAFGLYAHINFMPLSGISGYYYDYWSSFGTVAHELMHTLGAVDTYNFQYMTNDLMSVYTWLDGDYNITHVNPYYKIVWGWAEPLVTDSASDFTLYPQSAEYYQPLIVKTGDDDQYFIVEYRSDSEFDPHLSDQGNAGVTIWRVDKLGMEAIYALRQGISMQAVLRLSGESYVPIIYSDGVNIENLGEESAGVKITVTEISAESASVRIEYLTGGN